MDLTQDAKLRSMSVKSTQQTGSEGNLDDLLNWNGLTYTFPVTNTVVSARNLKPYPAHQQSYSAQQTVIFTTQTGMQFVDWRNSHFNFDLQLSSTSGVEKWDFGVGSACNLIQEVVVTARSGAELMRIENFNLWRVKRDYATRGTDWFSSIGSMTGYGMAQEDLTVATGTFHVTIPMSQFGGLFDTDQLCPSNICSGMRIEFRLAPDNVAIHTDLAPTGLVKVLSDLSITCDTYLLNDGAMRQLNETSARNGLEYVYTTVYHQRENVGNTSNVNIVLSKAVSRSLVCKAVRKRPNQNTFTSDYFINGLEDGISGMLEKYAWRLGSQYYPHQPFSNKSEMYHNLLYSYDQLVSQQTCSLSFQEYLDEHEMAAATFERSNLLRFSGVPINNSRTLSFEATYDTTQAGQQLNTEVHLFMEHVVVAKAFLNNIIVTV